MNTQDLQQQLLKIALLGSERQTQALHVSGALESLFQQLYPNGQVPTGDSRESTLLSSVAVVHQYQTVGRLATSFSGTLPTPDNKPAMPQIPVAAEVHLRRLLNDKSLSDLLEGWLVAVGDKGFQIPPAFIPALLDLSKHSKAIRPSVSAVVGPRGQWLAQQNPEWKSLLTLAVNDADETLDDAIWEEGNTAQRVDYLRRIRTKDAAAALNLLKAVWKQEAAAVRRELLQTLRTNLSLDDEEWLESCLDDRSKGVRQMAATLLGGMTHSAFSQRHQTRLNSWVQIQKKSGMLSKLSGKQELVVTPPESWDKAWLRDGVEEKPPKGTGAKAWWLQQSLALVPLSVWTEKWSLSPSSIIGLIEKHDWAAAIVTGWQTALLEYPDTQWVSEWLLKVNHESSAMWSSLDPEQAEAIVFQLLKKGGKGNDLSLLNRLLHPWSEAFSEKLSPSLANAIQYCLSTSDRNHYGMSQVMQHVATHLHLSSIDGFDKRLQPMLDGNNDYDYLQRAMSEMLFTLRFRTDMIAALNASDSQ